MKFIYLGTSGTPVHTGRVELLSSTGVSLVPKKYVEIAVQGSDANGAAPRVVVVDQAGTGETVP
jgi:hypothetical protein